MAAWFSSEKSWDAILKEADAIGLAFGVQTAGQAEDVGLKVYKVIQGEKGFIGEERKTLYQKGASSIKADAEDKEDFIFENLSELKACGFDFGVVGKEEFERIFEDGEDELFISGSVRDYGHTAKITGKFFTLMLTPRFDPTFERAFGSPPNTLFTESCPPVWQPDDDSGENGSFGFTQSPE